jgi:hypothetical protein
MMWTPGGQPDHLSFAGLRGSGGKGGNTTTNTSQQGMTVTQIPQWLQDAGQNAVGTAQQLAQRPYTPYTGQQVADVPQDTQAAYQGVRDLQGMQDPAFQASANAYQGLLGSAAPVTAGQVGADTGQLYGGYQQNVMNPAQGLLSGYLGNASPATVQQVGANATALMSPYSQNVIDPMLQAGQQQLALAKQGLAGQANNVGAFGGSRMGVQEGVADAQTALGTQLQVGNMLNSGWGQALTPGYNLANQASQQGYGAAGLLAGMGQSGYNAAQQQAGTLGANNLQAGLTAAQQLPSQALQNAQLSQQQAGALQASGAAQQTQQQALLDAQMGRFYEQQDWPVQNLDLLLSSVGAVPYGTTSNTAGSGTSVAQKNPGLLDTIGSIAGSAATIASL